MVVPHKFIGENVLWATVADHPARVQAEIVALHQLERRALLAREVTVARDVAIRKFHMLSILDEIALSN